MKLIQYALIFVNLLALIFFSIALYFASSNNQKKTSPWGLPMALSLIAYMVLLFAYVIVCLIGQNYMASILLIYILIPFVIGHYAKYETYKKFSFIQILCFALSFLTIINM